MKEHSNTGAREYAFQFLYYLESKGEKLNDIEKENYEDLRVEFEDTFLIEDDEHKKLINDSNKELAEKLIQGVLHRYNQLVEKVSEHINKKSWGSVEQVERFILLIAACELQLESDSNKNVIINEAINMAKKFGKEKSHVFINGVLDSVAATI